jgi:hypothetical protein
MFITSSTLSFSLNNLLRRRRKTEKPLMIVTPTQINSKTARRPLSLMTRDVYKVETILK